jgi:tripartite-type tricarboxylate transporter receptor subunit TctC
MTGTHAICSSMLRFSAALLFSGCAAFAQAQGYPSKTVTIVVPAAPGGPSDILGRLLAERMRERFGQSFIIENRGGAGGNLGAAAVARATPDGHTLLLTVDAPIVVNPALYEKMPYDPAKDLQGVAMIGDGGDVVLAVAAGSPAKTMAELVDSMRKDPRNANYVSSGNGFPSHIVGEVFKREAKFDAVHIPAKGAGAALQEFLSGRMSFSFPPASLAAPMAKGGKIRLLAVPAAKRNPLLPDVPTFAELGLPGVTTAHYWITVFAPGGTPRSVVDGLNAEIRRIAKTPEYRSLLERQGLAPSDLTPDEVNERVKKDLAYWQATVRPLGIRAD